MYYLSTKGSIELSKKWLCANNLMLNDVKAQNHYFGSGSSLSERVNAKLLGIKLLA